MRKEEAGEIKRIEEGKRDDLSTEPGDVMDCRICYGGEEGPLYIVCKCNAPVHEACLIKWMESKPDPTICEVCREEYAVKRGVQLKCDCNKGAERFFNSCPRGLTCRTAVRMTMLFIICLSGTLMFLMLLAIVVESSIANSDSAIWISLITAAVAWKLLTVRAMRLCLRGLCVKIKELLCMCCIEEMYIDRSRAERYVSNTEEVGGDTGAEDAYRHVTQVV